MTCWVIVWSLLLAGWQSSAQGSDATAPATAVQLISQLDLRDLPSLSVRQELDAGPTYRYYSATASVSAATAFYTAELQSRGWEVTPSPSEVVPEYRDVTFTKDGCFVRMTVGASGDEGVVGISLAHLGNVDLTTLPRLGDVAAHPLSTPTNVNYSVPNSILEATRFCREQLTQLGWHEYRDLYADLPEVPHVKQLFFCNQAERLMVNVSRDPRDPNAKQTIVSYMAHYAMPVDIPLMPDATDLRFSDIQHQARFQSPQSIPAVAESLQAHARELGWEVHVRDNSNAESVQWLLQRKNETGYDVTIRQQDGTSLVQYARATLKPQRQESNDVASLPASVPASGPTSLPAEDFAEQLQKEIQGTVQRELQAVQGELQKLGVDLPAGLVDRLLNDEEAEVDDTSSVSDAETVVSELLRDESIEQPAIALRDDSKALAELPRTPTLCTVRYAGNTYELKHAAAFKDPSDGQPIIVFSQEPLRVERARSMLRSGETPSVLDVLGDQFPPALELRLSEDYLSMSCFVDGASINRTSSDFKSEHLLSPKRVRGTVASAEVEQVFDQPFEFSASFDLDWLEASATSGAPAGLTASPGYEFPIPEGCAGVSQEKSPYRATYTAEVPAPLAQVVEFYQRELTAHGWQGEPPVSSDERTLNRTWKNAQGAAHVVLQQSAGSDHTQATIDVLNTQLATQHGIVPAAGQGKLLLANATGAEILVKIGSRSVKVAAGKGARDPATAVHVPVLPGKHRVTATIAGETSTEQLQIEAGSTWGVIAIPNGGMFASRVY